MYGDGHPLWIDGDRQGLTAGPVVSSPSITADGGMVFFDALRKFVARQADSWHTPAHAGGSAFLRSGPGREFIDHFGESLLRSDVSVSVGALGSLLEHTGPIGAAERNAARVFGADRTYFVLNGTSASDRVVGQFALAPDAPALVDRNCHKAVVHALIQSGARPLYLVPTRNRYGIIGPVPAGKLALQGADLAIVTNSTYDGICYDAVQVARTLSARVPAIHFDEAWFAYAAFHPLYRHRHATAVTSATLPGPDRPTVFATQSTHKMLAALSQASMIHINEAPRSPVPAHRFNEALMMHASTSPSYPMIASLDVATAMMDRGQGAVLIGDALTEAIECRKHLAEISRRESRFFRPWQPPGIASVPTMELAENACHWELEPGAHWHGFPGMTSGYAMLDPLKVTLLTPGGTAPDASVAMPAAIVSAYLEQRGIISERTGGYTILFLFSLGTTTDKWQRLCAALLDFKKLYDADVPFAEVLPDLVAAHRSLYEGMTLRQVCARMHRLHHRMQLPELLDSAYTGIPQQRCTPAASYRRLQQDATEIVPLTEAAGRTAATMIVLTPPGIPVILPGEDLGPADGPILRYLRALETFDKLHPGFENETHGVIREPGTGRYLIAIHTE